MWGVRLGDWEDSITYTNGSHPAIIQGGMGVAISGWELANAVAKRSQLGVVSGTALELVCARRLQLGDPGGHVRRALQHFPIPEVAKRVIDGYYVPNGKPPEAPFKNVRSMTITPSTELLELMVVANFVEVFLAKEGVSGPVGINFMRKIELPILAAAYGAILGGGRQPSRAARPPDEAGQPRGRCFVVACSRPDVGRRGCGGSFQPS